MEGKSSKNQSEQVENSPRTLEEFKIVLGPLVSEYQRLVSYKHINDDKGAKDKLKYVTERIVEIAKEIVGPKKGS